MKIKLTIFLILFVSLSVLCFIYLEKDKFKYRNSIKIIEEKYAFGSYDAPISWHFCCDKSEVPASLSDITGLDWELYKDPFSKKGEFLRYIPLFNRNNLMRESVLLISAGLDGIINTPYTDADTIYQDSVLGLFDFYDLPFNTGIPKYNLFDRFFGRKDFVVLFVNLVESNKKTIFDTIVDFSVYVDKLQERSYYTWSFYKNYYFEIDSNHIKSFTECGFEILNSGYTIRFDLFDCKEIQRYTSMDHFNMVGTMRHIDHEAKEIGFKLCMDPN